MAEREQLRGLLDAKLRILFQILSVFPLKFHYHPIFYPCFYGNSHLIRPIYIKILSVKSVQSVVSKNKKRKTILSKKVYFIRLFLENSKIMTGLAIHAA